MVLKYNTTLFLILYRREVFEGVTNNVVPERRGVYQIWDSYLCPLPLLIYIFAPTETFYKMRVCAPQSKKCQPFFCCKFVYFKSIGEKICILSINWEKICIFPLFCPLSIIFFIWPNNRSCYLAIFLPRVKQKNIHPFLNDLPPPKKKSGYAPGPLSIF